jgi:hypothetical protein
MFELFVVDVSVVTEVVVSMFELLVVDFSETGVCEELCGASDVVIGSDDNRTDNQNDNNI